MQRLKLKDQRELGSPKDLMLNDVSGYLSRQSQRKSHRIYCAFARIPTGSTGRRLVETAGDCSLTGSAFSKPGRKNVAGEALYEPFNPPHPDASASKVNPNATARPLRASYFRSNFTGVYLILFFTIMASKYVFFFNGHIRYRPKYDDNPYKITDRCDTANEQTAWRPQGDWPLLNALSRVFGTLAPG
jgi:hypothetical protein